MAFIDDELAVAADKIGDLSFADQALYQPDIHPTGRLALAGADDANLATFKRQKLSQPLDPLSQQLSTMHQDQGTAAAKCEDRGRDDCLTKRSGRGEHAEIVPCQRLNGRVLLGT